MFSPQEDLALGVAITLEFVGNDHTRCVRQPLEELAEKLLYRLLIPAALHQDSQYIPVLIYCPPQIVTFALDRQKLFVEVPFIAGPRAAATELIRIRMSEFAIPFSNRFIGHERATCKQELFYI